MDVFTLTLVSLAGWMNRQQQDVIDYLQEEVRILKELRGSKRPRFTDGQRAAGTGGTRSLCAKPPARVVSENSITA
jgi:hypothetical protein